jgi:hypothetical protein
MNAAWLPIIIIVVDYRCCKLHANCMHASVLKSSDRLAANNRPKTELFLTMFFLRCGHMQLAVQTDDVFEARHIYRPVARSNCRISVHPCGQLATSHS